MGKIDDKNNYLVSKAVDWGLKAPLKSETFEALKELKKRGKKSSGYPGLWPWLGSWWLSLGEGFRKRKTTGGEREKHENQICLGNRWWIKWPTAGVGVNATEKETNQVKLWLNPYLLCHQGLCERLTIKKPWGKTPRLKHLFPQKRMRTKYVTDTSHDT